MTVGGMVGSLMAVKEALSDRNGKFRIPRKIYFSIPLLAHVVENKPIAFKPGYEFLILDKKVSEVRLEKVPTLLKFRKEECARAYAMTPRACLNYKVDVSEPKVLPALIRREQEFIESHLPVKSLKTSRRSRVSSPTVEPQTRIKDPETVEHLINQLMSEDGNVRRGAADALGKIQDPRAIEPLLAALKDPSSQVRKRVVEALATMHTKRVIKALIQVWNDELKDVRLRAAESLAGIGASAVEPLIDTLGHKDSYFRWRAAWVLGRIKDPKALNQLTPRMIMFRW